MSSYPRRHQYDDDEDDYWEFTEEEIASGKLSYDKDYEAEDYEEDFTPQSSPAPKKKQKPITIWTEIISWIKIFAAAVIITFIFTQYIIVNAEVPTGSMKNTIMIDDKLIGFRLSYLFSEPKQGDVVIFKFPDDEEQIFVKRIIGVPGDIVTIASGKVYVNGTALEEPYLPEPMNPTGTEAVYVVPEGHYFVLGDNRNYSQDARYWKNTYVAKEKILAKVIFRYYDGYKGHYSFSKIH